MTGSVQGLRISRAALVGCVLLLAAGAASAATSWRAVKTDSDAGDVCLEIEGREFDYTRLDTQEPAALDLRGPRRLKIVSRYLFTPSDPAVKDYVIRVLLDGREVLRKTLTGSVLHDAGPCKGKAGDAAALKRIYVQIPTGRHEVLVFAESGDGSVAARFFRETQQRKEKDIAYAPEGYDEVYHLQFASGSQSAYYHFGSDVPLRFSVKGPTNLKVYTRLDFDHTMNGDQNYSLELTRDGVSQNVFHYHASKLSAAAYVERPDILPGGRKLLRISVPKGQHVYELRCVRPDACGIATQIRIPEADLKP